MTGDLFENLRDAMGCMYISDIRLEKNKKRAISIASYLRQKYYSEKQWNDLVDYLKHTPSGDIINLSKGQG